MGFFRDLGHAMLAVQDTVPLLEEYVEKFPQLDTSFYQKEIEYLRNDVKFAQKLATDNKAEALFWRQKALELMSKKEEK